jgi:hypothetical protein
MAEATKTEAAKPKGDDALAYVLTALAKSATFHEEATAKAVNEAIAAIGSTEDYEEAKAKADAKAAAKAAHEANEANVG